MAPAFVEQELAAAAPAPAPAEVAEELDAAAGEIAAASAVVVAAVERALGATAAFPEERTVAARKPGAVLPHTSVEPAVDAGLVAAVVEGHN